MLWTYVHTSYMHVWLHMWQGITLSRCRVWWSTIGCKKSVRRDAWPPLLLLSKMSQSFSPSAFVVPSFCAHRPWNWTVKWHVQEHFPIETCSVPTPNVTESRILAPVSLIWLSRFSLEDLGGWREWGCLCLFEEVEDSHYLWEHPSPARVLLVASEGHLDSSRSMESAGNSLKSLLTEGCAWVFQGGLLIGKK